jgi:hypothetical protein
MEGLVPARMAQERAIAAAGVELYASPRWTDAAWRADRSWRRNAALERRHTEAVKRHAAKVEPEWRALQDAEVAAGRPIVALYAVLDGTAPASATPNGHASTDLVLPRKPDEVGPPTARTRKLRRIATARRLIAAAQLACGRQNATTWLAERLAG